MKKPRILFFDVETAPVLAWIWRVGPKINIQHDQIKAGQKFDIICIAYKWQGESKIHSLSWDLKSQDSSKMIEAFTKVVESADLAIAHNGDSFDVKQINTQRLMHNQRPIAWPTSEDTLKQFRKHFAFPSYKLDYIAKTLIGAGKDKMCFQDWIDVVEGKSAAALRKMISYCKKDVLRLEQVFNRASAHFTPKAHAGLIADTGRGACPRCASVSVISSGFRTSRAGRYRRWHCNACGSHFQGKRCPM